MPRVFTTPMFWTEDERAGLKGTDIEGKSTLMLRTTQPADIIDRIGKEDAEKEYKDTIEPLLKVSSHSLHHVYSSRS